MNEHIATAVLNNSGLIGLIFGVIGSGFTIPNLDKSQNPYLRTHRQIDFDKSKPLVIGEFYVIEGLQLRAHVGQQGIRGIQLRQEFIALIDQILNKLTF